MSTNTPYQVNGQNTHGGSVKQGTQEAQNGQIASAQQPGESYGSFQTRMGAYNAAKSG